MKRVVISAPFGNYLNFPEAASTLGTFTWEYRGGTMYRLWRCLRTLRYYPRLKAWVNKLGLPNPGIRSLPYLGYYGDKIISVAAFNEEDWRRVLKAAASLCPLAIEMNISCPNVEHYAAELDIAVDYSDIVILKLPPVGYMPTAKRAASLGFRRFHCCNTLPTPGGGLSGKPLMQLSLRAVAEVREHADVLIGGGGITSVEDAMKYFEAGATNVSLASCLFFPWNWSLPERIAHALRT